MIIILHGHIRNFIWVSDLWKSNITGGSHFRTLPVFEYGMILHKWKAIRVSTTKACKGNNRREKKLYDYNEIVLFWNTVLWSDFSQKKGSQWHCSFRTNKKSMKNWVPIFSWTAVWFTCSLWLPDCIAHPPQSRDDEEWSKAIWGWCPKNQCENKCRLDSECSSVKSYTSDESV